jgi:LysR family nitrogen assimilation transcriptional regulator
VWSNWAALRASSLSQAQPALSRQVRTLEVELRQPPLERNGRGVTLTEAGKPLLAHARGILQQVERAQLDLEDHRGAATGRLAIGLPPSVSRTLTGPLVNAFRERFPKATLSVVDGLSNYMMEWLAIGRLDCAVVYNVTPSPTVDSSVLDEQLYLVSPRRREAQAHGPPIALSKIADYRLVIPGRCIHCACCSKQRSPTRRKPTVALEIESIPPSSTWFNRNRCMRYWRATQSNPPATSGTYLRPVQACR